MLRREDEEDEKDEVIEYDPTVRPQISKSAFDYCAYNRFVADEDFKDPDADEDGYNRQFIMKHSTEEEKDMVVKMEVILEEPNEVKWH